MLGKKGFTLIEMLIVVFVVAVGLVGALSFFNINISNQLEAKNELIAAGLAQEGADLVRNIRDYNLLNASGSLAWYSNLNNNTVDGGGDLCQIADYQSLSNHRCLNNSNTTVCLNPSSGRYYQCAASNANKTEMQRTVNVIRRDGNLDNGGRLEVISKVTWNGRTTTAADVLYDNSF